MSSIRARRGNRATARQCCNTWSRPTVPAGRGCAVALVQIPSPGLPKPYASSSTSRRAAGSPDETGESDGHGAANGIVSLLLSHRRSSIRYQEYGYSGKAIEHTQLAGDWNLALASSCSPGAARYLFRGTLLRPEQTAHGCAVAFVGLGNLPRAFPSCCAVRAISRPGAADPLRRMSDLRANSAVRRPEPAGRALA